LAKVEKFKKAVRQRNSVHKPVHAEVHDFEIDGRKYLQIDTYGKVDREIPGKISQSFQFDREAAVLLKKLLESTFKI
jgi:hypothetical protein